MKLFIGKWTLIGFTLTFLSYFLLSNPTLAQVNPGPTMGVKIVNPSSNESVPVGNLTISGTSTDDSKSNCGVFVDWNDLKPMQNVTPTGPNGKGDYSNWTYTYNKKYHEIIEGQNELTSKITCVNGVANSSSKYYSINVTGVKASQDNNRGNDSKGIEDQNYVLPTASNQTNTQNANYKILPLYKSNNNTESGQEATAPNNGKTQLLSSDEDKSPAVETTQDKSSADDNTQLLSSDEDKSPAVETTQDKSSADDNTQLLSSDEDKSPAVETTQDKSSADDNTQLLSSDEDKSPAVETTQDKSSADDNTQLLSSDEDKSDKSTGDLDDDIFDFKIKYNDDSDHFEMKSFNGLLNKYINDKVKHVKEKIMGMD